MRRGLIFAVIGWVGFGAWAWGNDTSLLRMALVNAKSLPCNSGDTVANAANLQTNIDNINLWVDRAAAQGAEFVAFPDMSLHGYKYGSIMPWLSLDGPEVQQIRNKAISAGVYIDVGLAERDVQNRKWNTQIVIDPQGQIVAAHHKIWLVDEVGYTEIGTDVTIAEVKGLKIGLLSNADGSDYQNLRNLADAGAEFIYCSQANTNAQSLWSFYNFRANWAGAFSGVWTNQQTSNGGPNQLAPQTGWLDQLNVGGALNNAARYYSPYVAGETSSPGFSSGAWFIQGDGTTLPNNAETQVYGWATDELTPNPTGLAVAQKPANGLPFNAAGANTYEYMLIANVPEPGMLGVVALGVMALGRPRGWGGNRGRAHPTPT